MTVVAAWIWAAAQSAVLLVALCPYQDGHHVPVEVLHRRLKAHTLSIESML